VPREAQSGGSKKAARRARADLLHNLDRSRDLPRPPSAELAVAYVTHGKQATVPGNEQRVIVARAAHRDTIADFHGRGAVPRAAITQLSHAVSAGSPPGSVRFQEQAVLRTCRRSAHLAGLGERRKAEGTENQAENCEAKERCAGVGGIVGHEFCE